MCTNNNFTIYNNNSDNVHIESYMHPFKTVYHSDSNNKEHTQNIDTWIHVCDVINSIVTAHCFEIDEC